MVIETETEVVILTEKDKEELREEIKKIVDLCEEGTMSVTDARAEIKRLEQILGIENPKDSPFEIFYLTNGVIYGLIFSVIFESIFIINFILNPSANSFSLIFSGLIFAGFSFIIMLIAWPILIFASTFLGLFINNPDLGLLMMLFYFSVLLTIVSLTTLFSYRYTFNEDLRLRVDTRVKKLISRFRRT